MVFTDFLAHFVWHEKVLTGYYLTLQIVEGIDHESKRSWIPKGRTLRFIIAKEKNGMLEGQLCDRRICVAERKKFKLLRSVDFPTEVKKHFIMENKATKKKMSDQLNRLIEEASRPPSAGGRPGLACGADLLAWVGAHGHAAYIHRALE